MVALIPAILIHCQVLEVVPNERLVYAWKGGHEGNVGYGAPLDTVVTFTLARETSGTRVRLVHSGFVLPRNETATATWRRLEEEGPRSRHHRHRRRAKRCRLIGLPHANNGSPSASTCSRPRRI